MRSRSILGVLVLSALALSAFGVTNASAEGITAAVCEEIETGGTYGSSQCATPSTPGNWETTPISEGAAKEVTASAIGSATFKGVVAGANVEVTCAKTTTTGSLKNVAGEETQIEGNEITNNYTECHASLQKDTTKKCEVESITGTAGVKGTIATNLLKAISGAEHKVTFSPTVGSNFTKFRILKGECLGANVEVTVTGSISGIANTEKHSHVTFTPATNGSGFKANGGAASYEGTHTGAIKGTSDLIGAVTGPGPFALTAVGCQEVAAGAGKYDNWGCATPKTVGSWETEQVPLNESTAVVGAAVGSSVWRLTSAGAQLEVTCDKASTTGNVTNIEVNGEMRIEGDSIVTDYTECHASLQANTAKKCEVESITGTSGIKGTIGFNSLKSITGPEHKVTFSPASVEAFTKFRILKGECLGSTAEITFSGSLIGIANTEEHDHVTFEPATNGTGIKANGAAVTFEGTTTAVMKGTANPVGAETF